MALRPRLRLFQTHAHDNGADGYREEPLNSEHGWNIFARITQGHFILSALARPDVYVGILYTYIQSASHFARRLQQILTFARLHPPSDDSSLLAISLEPSVEDGGGARHVLDAEFASWYWELAARFLYQWSCVFHLFLFRLLLKLICMS
jgi:hypothetical protein